MRAPAPLSRVSAAENAAATSLSMPSSTSVCGTAKRRPSTGNGASATGGSPASTASSTAQQATVAAIGPIESRVCDSGMVPAVGTRRAVGLNPTMPQSAAGMRQEPPVSLPSAAIAMPSVTATAEPDEEPPGMRPVLRS